MAAVDCNAGKMRKDAPDCSYEEKYGKKMKNEKIEGISANFPHFSITFPAALLPVFSPHLLNVNLCCLLPVGERSTIAARSVRRARYMHIMPGPVDLVRLHLRDKCIVYIKS